MSVSTLRPLLPLGSVVVLHNGDVKLMIIGRVPLYRDESIFGYFDYMAMRYPVGLTEDSVAYFNAEDIAEVMASAPGTFRASLTASLTGAIA